MRGGWARSAGSATRKAKMVARRMRTTPTSTLAASAATAAAARPPIEAITASRTSAAAQAASSTSALRVLARSRGRSASSARPSARAAPIARPISVRMRLVTLIAPRSEARFDPRDQVLERVDAREELVVGGDHVHGAGSVEVRSIMSHTARSYGGHFLRLRQSSAVIL